MSLFKKNTESTKTSDKVAGRIANAILSTQERFAILLQGITNRWQKKQQWLFLYFTCLLLGGLSIVSIITPFQNREENEYFIPKSISVPQKLPPGRDIYLITKAEYLEVQNFKQSNPDLNKENPALYDSLLVIEQVYNAQKK